LGFGAGLSPIAHGTFGTLAAIPLYLFLSGASAMVYLLCLIGGFIFGIYICGQVANSLKSRDPPRIVWDEILGYLATMYLIQVSLYTIITGFLLFRLFDIIKPWPIRIVDRQVQGGFGIMIDDMIAAVFSAIVLRFTIPFLPG